MAKGPESAYTTKLLSELRRIPHSEWDKIAAGPWQVSGLPDIIGCVYGLYVAIEVKDKRRHTQPNGGLTEKQAAKLGKIERAGGLTVLLYTSASPQLTAVRIFQEVKRHRGNLRLPLP